MISQSTRKLILQNPSLVMGGSFLMLMILVAIIGPFFTEDPTTIRSYSRLKGPSWGIWFGSDWLGRDVFARAIYGARISIAVGVLVMVCSLLFGTLLGILAGYIRAFDNIIMRIMDGLMSIPGILLAIALVTVIGAKLQTVVIAISVTEIPRVVRIVRSVVLSVREEPYVEAAIISGTPTYLLLIRHVLPNTIGPLLVQGTFICGGAIVIEAILGFIGAGIPSELPSWGNIMAEGRVYFQLTPWVIFMPGVMLSLTVLAMNMIGDGLRSTLDPRLARKL